MTGQSLLDRMELVNAELQLQSGEEDVTKGLLALNVAQDYFESLVALRPKMFGSAIGTVVTAANTENTAFPTGLMRVDRLQLIGDNSRPAGDLRRLHRAGGHSVNAYWYLNLISSQSSGKPHSYWTNGTNIYWQPLPSGVYTVRWYGFQVASDITAGGTFAYPDSVAFPMAVFATKLMKLGLDDPIEELSKLADNTFSPVLDAMELFNRDGALPLEYTQFHTE